MTSQGLSPGQERLVAAATTLFVRDGYRNTSMKAIAKQAGVSPPAVYWHYSSKQELYLAAMERLLDEFVAFVSSRVDAASPGDRLRQFVEAHVTWRLRERESAGAFTAAVGSRDAFRSLSVPQRASLVAKQRNYLGLLESILSSGHAEGTFQKGSRVTSLAIVTMCDHVSTWYDDAGEAPPERIAQLYGDCVLQMVAPRRDGEHADRPNEGSGLSGRRS